MAKQKLAIRRPGSSIAKKKYEGLIAARGRAAARARQEAAQRAGSLVGVGACALVGYLEKEGKMPSLGGFEPTLVIGVGLGFLLPAVVKGKVGQMAAEAGAAVAGVAAYKLGKGDPIKVGEDDDYA